ncbi:unnamed protein product [Litomosoides sigmodontis]|uniref:Uncharacterized protein n=1 Tax=Litomosoides sigmodontis TaxID=42156 RepID=A0A3P6UUY6_LITSI|nr:unnamed protein product [Litomosoides sigmodontis]
MDGSMDCRDKSDICAVTTVAIIQLTGKSHYNNTIYKTKEEKGPEICGKEMQRKTAAAAAAAAAAARWDRSDSSDQPARKHRREEWAIASHHHHRDRRPGR